MSEIPNSTLWVVLGIVLVVAAFIAAFMVKLNSVAARDGYKSFGAYMRATPRNEAEKRDAVDTALLGLALCILGIAVAPVFLLGLYPFYYGARKVAYSSLGLGKTEEVAEEG